VQSYGLHVYSAIAAEADVCATGNGLDATLGGASLPAGADYQALGREDAFELALAKCTYFDSPELDSLLGSPKASKAARNMAQRFWDTCPEQPTAGDILDWFALSSRGPQVLRFRQAWMRRYMEDYSPSFDLDFLSLVFRAPVSQRAGHRLYQRCLLRWYPRLAAIPYQRTLLPATAPVDLWPKAEDIEAQREALALAVWRESRGGVHVPYTRHSTDYDLWLRRDPHWIALTDAMLLSPDCRLGEIGVRLPYVKRIVEEHRAAVNSHRQKLLQLLTLEILLRTPYWQGRKLPKVSETWS